jgi:hypothetical protein
MSVEADLDGSFVFAGTAIRLKHCLKIPEHFEDAEECGISPL